MNCNIGETSAPNTCTINAGDTLTVEMHQQPGDRNCSELAIGGAHYGPSTSKLFARLCATLLRNFCSLDLHGQGRKCRHGRCIQRWLVQDL